ncbi:3-methyladenine DNA glycosylase/8-oxoguanine DNA glycosylase [Nakamurella sp. UYEF19]|uniref:DNA-3-methyladenine glycosylase family protein n=1 Tax=Nakamurella sp. UYEF19 TaxID=1756392 RepID=UPI0033997B72
MDLELSPPYEVGPAMAILASCAVPGVEITDPVAATHTRLLTVPGSAPVEVTVRLSDDHVSVLHRAVDADLGSAILSKVRHWLDLDVDPMAVKAALGDDPVIGGLVSARPGLRVIRYPDGFEAAVMTVLGQQVSVAAARTFGGRTVVAYGTDVPGSDLRAFPTPVSLAAATPVELQSAIGITHARARTVHALATACRDHLTIDPAADRLPLLRELLALPGIGPWTTEYLAVRALGDRNAFPAGDLVLQRALGVRTAAQARATAIDWTPYRAYALFHLWSAVLGI